MRIVALFNLKDGVHPGDYEAWARERDLPGVRALGSVNSFDVLRATGVLFSTDAPPYAYVELFDVTDLDAFLADAGSEAVGKLASEMSAFAAGTIFITTEAL